MNDLRRFAPATLRNREVIGDVLEGELSASGTVLEIASGSGEHAVTFAKRFPHLNWQPSDHDPDALRSIEAWRDDAALTNLIAPIEIDASRPDWGVDTPAAIFCANMIHISPWRATEGIFAGAGRMLAKGAPLILYGPFFEEGVEPATSNLQFDESLKSRDPEWGIRNIGALDDLATKNGLERTERYAMPANNLTLVYRKA